MDLHRAPFLRELKDFVQQARLNTWLLGDHQVLSYRPGSRNLQFRRENLTYLGTYVDESQGDMRSFRGRESIQCDGVNLYEFVYQGGLIRE